MTRKAHQNGLSEFRDLDFAEQAKSISALTNGLGRSINANLRAGASERRDVEAIRKKRINQIKRMIDRIS